MRALISKWLPLCVLLSGCPGAQRLADRGLVQSELELAFDDGQAADRPILPTADGEWLFRFEPTLPAYKPHRLRLLVAQPGKIRFSVYSHDVNGRPGPKLGQFERVYEVNHVSSGLDGKWVLEPLGDLPAQTGPVWLGVSVPVSDPAAARLWASRKESGQVFSADAEPGTALQSTALKTTPMLRLLVTAEVAVPTKPEAAPPAASAEAAKRSK